MIKVEFDDPKPIYKQIVEQVFVQIKSGDLKPGDRLPTERELAAELQVARGTVKKAYKELADNNIIEVIQGSGSYVYDDRDAYGAEQRKLALDLIDQTLTKLESWNMTDKEIWALLRLIYSKHTITNPLVRIALIDCNPESLALFKRQLAYIPNTASSAFLVDTVLLEDHPARLFADFDLILTTATHYEQVLQSLKECPVRPAAVDVSTSRQTIVSISTLPQGCSLGILCQSNKFSNLICEQVELFSGRRGPIPVCFDTDIRRALKFMQKYDAVIVSPDLPLLDPAVSKGALDDYQAQGKKIIPFDYFINRGSLIYIEELVDKAMQNKNTHKVSPS